MKAVQLIDVFKVGLNELADYDINQLASDEVIVKVMACGICGSDYHYFRHGGLGTHKVPMPFKLGHEVSGIVIGSKDKSIIGDRVAVDPVTNCGVCKFCYDGRSNLCSKHTFLGSNADGGMQEFIKVNIHQLFKLNDSQSFRYGVMLEGLGVAMHNMSRVTRTSDTLHSIGNVAVIGAGPIGLLTGIVSMVEADDLIVFEPLAYRRKFAESIGLKQTRAYLSQDMMKYFQTIFDCAGTQESYESAVQLAEPGAKIVLCGIPETDYIQRNPHVERIKELTMLNTRRSAIPYDLANMYADSYRVPLDKFVTNTDKFSNAQTAFEIASSYREGVIKMVLTP